jgi:hypothetical protein
LARKSDLRSSFLAVEKKASLKKLGMKSGRKLLKNSLYKILKPYLNKKTTQI